MWGWGTRRGYVDVGVGHHRRAMWVGHNGRGYVGVGHNRRSYVGVGHNRRGYVGVGTIGGAMLSWGWGSKQGADLYMEEELC